jgi:hypothetical protein
MAPDDWIRKKDGSVTFDRNVHNYGDAKDFYGEGTEYIGKTGTYINSSGEQITLNSNGQALKSEWLPEVTVTDSKSVSTTDVVSKVGMGAGTANDAITMGLESSKNVNLNAAGEVIGKVGTGIGVASAVTSVIQAVKNPTAGNLVNAALDGVLTKANPYVATVDVILDVAGYKQAALDFVDKVSNENSEANVKGKELTPSANLNMSQNLKELKKE